MLLLSRRLSKTDSSAGNRSIGGSLVLYWLCMVLAMLAAGWYYTGGDLAALPQKLQSLGADSLPHAGAKLI